MRIKTKHFENRGSAYTIYERREFDIDFVQDKISKSYQGVIRGFHGDNQTWKLITCLYGRIKFVTYDIDNDRKETYILDGDSKESVSILVPPRVLNAHQVVIVSFIISGVIITLVQKISGAFFITMPILILNGVVALDI
jgi:dTDP-4-dehydrorhamnose 3,5-epimerase